MNVRVPKPEDGTADLLPVFMTSRKGMETRVGKLKSPLRPGGMLWVTTPEGRPGIRTDVNRDVIQEWAAAVTAGWNMGGGKSD